MRVIAGTAKGRSLFAPAGERTRPTADRTKENVFNIIAGLVQGAYFLDVFSGSGAMGIEALSRGAAEAVFVDNSSVCRDVIHKNLLHTGLSGQSKVIYADFRKALAVCEAEGRRFDIVFMDPPYAKGFAEAAVSELAARELLNDGGLLIVEISSRETPPMLDDRLECCDIRRYGETSFLFARMVAR